MVKQRVYGSVLKKGYKLKVFKDAIILNIVDKFQSGQMGGN